MNIFLINRQKKIEKKKVHELHPSLMFFSIMHHPFIFNGVLLLKITSHFLHNLQKTNVRPRKEMPLSLQDSKNITTKK
jgi:hypothetical protein